MTPAAIGCWLSAMLLLPSSAPPPDLHVVVSSQFHYLSSVRPTTLDVWMSDGKRATKIGDRVAIRREDLGVTWRIDVKGGTYTEDKIVASPPPEPAKEDIHTAGFEYEPEFDWQLAETGEKSTIAGRPCRRTVATGDADYAQTTVSFWSCDAIAGVGHRVTDLVVGMLRSRSAAKMVADTAAKSGAWVLSVEETQEPAIAPTMTITASVTSLEATAAPAGTFDLPANVKKAGAK